MIYLASPYSHPDRAIREERFRLACMAAASLMRAGKQVFSPVAHSHSIAAFGLPTAWEYWEPVDRHHLAHCDEVMVLMQEGWQSSEGVQAEIQIARELGKPVQFVGLELALDEEMNP